MTHIKWERNKLDLHYSRCWESPSSEQVTTFGYYTSDKYYLWENIQSYTCQGCSTGRDRPCVLTVTPGCCSAHSYLQFKTSHPTFSPDVMIWAVMNNEWLIGRQMFGALYLWICQVGQWEETVGWFKKKKKKKNLFASDNMMWPGSNMVLRCWLCTVRSAAAGAVQTTDYVHSLQAQSYTELRACKAQV